MEWMDRLRNRCSARWTYSTPARTCRKPRGHPGVHSDLYAVWGTDALVDVWVTEGIGPTHRWQEARGSVENISGLDAASIIRALREGDTTET